MLLGANDHGKSNILQAMQHLNDESPFLIDDLNWDSTELADKLPHIEFEFELDETDQEWIATRARELAEASSAQTEASTEGVPDPPADTETNTETKAREKGRPREIKAAQVPTKLVISRTGISGARVVNGMSSVSGEVTDAFVAEFMPRVELITPFDSIPDSTTLAELPSTGHEFMRGIFYYAGLPKEKWAGIFEQNLRTGRALREASDRLNATLRASWGQGESLEFVLVHDSAKQAVELRLKDPSVATQDVHASQRSNGFTHFFALKTILYARQQEASARSYIWLFDEPGIYLHPAGQHDLLQAIEALAQRNQVLYTTHSIFLVNKNYPTRHRLIVKTKRGTVLDTKPFTSGWHPALQALGLSLPGTILFASHVLLTEGDSEPILLYSLLQKAVEAGWIDSDLNPLAVIATGDARNAEVLLRILWEARPRPKIAFLFDGDRGGSDRYAFLKQILATRKIPHELLFPGTTVEDHLALTSSVYVPSLASYLASLDLGKTEAELGTSLAKSYDLQFGKKVTNGLASWARQEGHKLLGLDSDPSPVGTARAYVEALSEIDFKAASGNDLKRARALVQQVVKLLGLPSRTARQDMLLSDADG